MYFLKIEFKPVSIKLAVVLTKLKSEFAVKKFCKKIFN